MGRLTLRGWGMPLEAAGRGMPLEAGKGMPLEAGKGRAFVTRGKV